MFVLVAFLLSRTFKTECIHLCKCAIDRIDSFLQAISFLRVWREFQLRRWRGGGNGGRPWFVKLFLRLLRKSFVDGDPMVGCRMLGLIVPGQWHHP